MVTRGSFSTVSHRLGGFAASFLHRFLINISTYTYIFKKVYKYVYASGILSFFFFFALLGSPSPSLSPYESLQSCSPHNTPLGLPFISPHSHDLIQKHGSENTFIEIVCRCWFYPNGMASCILVFILFFSFNSTP